MKLGCARREKNKIETPSRRNAGGGKGGEEEEEDRRRSSPARLQPRGFGVSAGAATARRERWGDMWVLRFRWR